MSRFNNFLKQMQGVKTAPSRANPAKNNDDDENEGLPSVNRRTSSNRLLTALGFLFILIVAAFLIFSVNSGKPSERKNSRKSEQITNNMPPLLIPDAPLPPTTSFTSASTANQATPIMEGGASPLAMQTIGSGHSQPMDWTERKMTGTLLVESNTHSTNQPTASASYIDANGNSQPVAYSGASTPSNSRSELGSRLEATSSDRVSASLIGDRNFLIAKGTALDCALETALDSTLPGLTTCRLTRDTYSDNGQVLLLERGTQLVGEYQGGIKQGQVRMFILWTRAKTPKGVIVNLNSPSTDALGKTGVNGWVDNHFGERFGAAILMTLIKDSIQATLARQQANGGSVVYSNTTSGGERVIEKILDSTANIPPTLVKNQGDHIQIMVARDLDFSTVYRLAIKQ